MVRIHLPPAKKSSANGKWRRPAPPSFNVEQQLPEVDVGAPGTAHSVLPSIEPKKARHIYLMRVGQHRGLSREEASEQEYRGASRRSRRIPEGSQCAPRSIPARDRRAARGRAAYNRSMVRCGLVGHLTGSFAISLSVGGLGEARPLNSEQLAQLAWCSRRHGPSGVCAASYAAAARRCLKHQYRGQ